MLRLPDYEVVIHILLNDFSKDLAKEIELTAREFELEDSTEYKGVRDYHWTFKKWDDAIAAGEKFKHLVKNPNLIMLLVKANYDSTIKAISHKDLVRQRLNNSGRIYANS